MQNLFFRIRSYIAHRLKTIKSRRGYGVHSPYAFNFIRTIINPETPSYFYCFNQIEQLRYRLRHNKEKVILDNGKTAFVKTIAKTSASPLHDGQLLFRTALFMQSKTLIELGTSLGISTAYLACTNKKAKVISIDHNIVIQNLAKHNANELKIKNIEFVNGKFEEALPSILKGIVKLDFVFFDGHHIGDATLRYFDIAKAKSHAQSIFIFHDIHWSKDMHQAWSSIVSDPLVSLSIECYNLGFIFFNPELNKKHYCA